jgi:four helix bundle protein
MSNHKELKVYQKAMDLVTEIYQMTKLFPPEEKYGLTSQVRRASISVPSNIAEGAARKNTKEYIQFLYYSLGSAAEIETQLEISKRLGFIDDIEKINKNNNEIIYMLTGLIKSLSSKIR